MNYNILFKFLSLILLVLLLNCEYLAYDNQFYISKSNYNSTKIVKIEPEDVSVFLTEIDGSCKFTKKIGLWNRDCNFEYVIISIDKKNDTTYVWLSGNKFKISKNGGNMYFLSTVNIEELFSKYFTKLE